MTESSYGQFCPVAMAAEILCTRWTMLVVRELVCGSRRFNDLRRGVPRMSPALLSKRLKELEQAGVICRLASRSDPGILEYELTKAGRDLRPIIESLGSWGHKWVESSISLKNLDPTLLMWDMRRRLDPTPMPQRQCVIQFLYLDLSPTKRNFWLIVAPGQEVDLCTADPGFEVDLFVSTDLRTMTAIWMGITTVLRANEAGSLTFTGDKRLSDDMQTWLGLSIFSHEKDRATA
jgi:DNA-binding HxlR family transcriptional regulator